MQYGLRYFCTRLMLGWSAWKASCEAHARHGHTCFETTTTHGRVLASVMVENDLTTRMFVPSRDIVDAFVDHEPSVFLARMPANLFPGVLALAGFLLGEQRAGWCQHRCILRLIVDVRSRVQILTTSTHSVGESRNKERTVVEVA